MATQLASTRHAVQLTMRECICYCTTWVAHPSLCWNWILSYHNIEVKCTAPRIKLLKMPSFIKDTICLRMSKIAWKWLTSACTEDHVRGEQHWNISGCLPW